jgi:hypothetical protein
MSRLVRLYPRAWRARYGDEFAALIAERPPTLADRIDIVRGAVDARLHPQTVVGDPEPEPQPWTHRIPGVLTLSAGVALSVAVVSIASSRNGDDWGDAGTLLGLAPMLMLLSLPGDYLASYGRRIAVGIAALVACYLSARILGWGAPALILGVGGWLAVFCGLLTMAAIRARVGARGRWILVVATVLVPFGVVVLLTILRESLAVTIVPSDSPLLALTALPYGLAWLALGGRMAVRGTATMTDPPTGRPRAVEVPA